MSNYTSATTQGGLTGPSGRPYNAVIESWVVISAQLLLASAPPHILMIPIGLLGNVLIMIFFGRKKSGVGKTLKVYYVALATMQIMALFSAHVVSFVDSEMYVLSSNSFSVSVFMNEQACRITQMLWFWSSSCENWIYVAMNFEKAISVSNPLKSRGFFTKRKAFAALVVIASAGSPLAVLTYLTVASVRNPINGFICGNANTIGTIAVVATRLYAMIFVYAVPTILSLAMNVFLIRMLRKHEQVRQKVVTDASGQLERQRRERQATLTVTMISVIHCVFYVPLGLAYAVGTIVQQIVQNSILASQMYAILAIIRAYSVFAESVNAIVYYFRVPAFRNFVHCRSIVSKQT